MGFCSSNTTKRYNKKISKKFRARPKELYERIMRADKIILGNWNYSLELNLLLKFCWFILEFSNSGLGLGYHEIKVLQKFTSPKHVCTRSSKNLEYFDPSENMVPMRLKEHHHPLSKPHKKIKKQRRINGNLVYFHWH